jgi:hypothetical protein
MAQIIAGRNAGSVSGSIYVGLGEAIRSVITQFRLGWQRGADHRLQIVHCAVGCSNPA